MNIPLAGDLRYSSASGVASSSRPRRRELLGSVAAAAGREAVQLVAEEQQRDVERLGLGSTLPRSAASWSACARVVRPGGRIATTFWIPLDVLERVQRQLERLAAQQQQPVGRRRADPDRAVGAAEPAQVVGDRLAADQRDELERVGRRRPESVWSREREPWRAAGRWSDRDVDARSRPRAGRPARSGTAARRGRRSRARPASPLSGGDHVDHVHEVAWPRPLISDRDRDHDRRDREPDEHRRRGTELGASGARTRGRRSARRSTVTVRRRTPLGGVLVGGADDLVVVAHTVGHVRSSIRSISGPLQADAGEQVDDLVAVHLLALDERVGDLLHGRGWRPSARRRSRRPDRGSARRPRRLSRSPSTAAIGSAHRACRRWPGS